MISTGTLCPGLLLPPGTIAGASFVVITLALLKTLPAAAALDTTAPATTTTAYPWCNAVDPCANNATCSVVAGSGYHCTCEPGWVGINCTENIDECASIPCKNGGSCMDLVNGFQCICLSGYEDATCATQSNQCSSNPCLNGDCENLVGRYECTCAPGFTGATCAVQINECASNPCENGGTCTDLVGTYACSCVRGYEGFRCESEVNECASNPCQNGGMCKDSTGSYTCECKDGYEGTDCEVGMDKVSYRKRMSCSIIHLRLNDFTLGALLSLSDDVVACEPRQLIPRCDVLLW